MILRTFTRDEVIDELHTVLDLFEERSRNFSVYNKKILEKKLRKQKDFFWVFSCEYKGQRYFQKVNFFLEHSHIGLQPQSVITVFQDSKEPFVLIHSPINHFIEDQFIRGSLELRIFSAHFVNRYFERTRMGFEDASLIEKTLVILTTMQSLCPSTVEDDVIRRYAEPALNFKFLQEGEKVTECTYLNDGDIAIIERYGIVPVWRTFVSKDMLFKDQLDFVERPDVQDAIHFAKEISNKLKD